MYSQRENIKILTEMYGRVKITSVLFESLSPTAAILSLQIFGGYPFRVSVTSTCKCRVDVLRSRLSVSLVIRHRFTSWEERRISVILIVALTVYQAVVSMRW